MKIKFAAITFVILGFVTIQTGAIQLSGPRSALKINTFAQEAEDVEEYPMVEAQVDEEAEAEKSWKERWAEWKKKAK